MKQSHEPVNELNDGHDKNIRDSTHNDVIAKPKRRGSFHHQLIFDTAVAVRLGKVVRQQPSMAGKFRPA